jgi:hypothetical protein
MTLSSPNSPFFNERNWVASREALAFANAPKTALAKVASATIPRMTQAAPVGRKVAALKFSRNPISAEIVTDAEIEAAKVVNTETPTVTDTKAAELLGLANLTVKKLRAVCRARGFKGYSKLKKAELLTMLG